MVYKPRERVTVERREGGVPGSLYFRFLDWKKALAQRGFVGLDFKINGFNKHERVAGVLSLESDGYLGLIVSATPDKHRGEYYILDDFFQHLFAGSYEDATLDGGRAINRLIQTLRLGLRFQARFEREKEGYIEWLEESLKGHNVPYDQIGSTDRLILIKGNWSVHRLPISDLYGTGGLYGNNSRYSRDELASLRTIFNEEATLRLVKSFIDKSIIESMRKEIIRNLRADFAESYIFPPRTFDAKLSEDRTRLQIFEMDRFGEGYTIFIDPDTYEYLDSRVPGDNIGMKSCEEARDEVLVFLNEHQGIDGGFPQGFWDRTFHQGEGGVQGVL